jgi:hypothetical protein
MVVTGYQAERLGYPRGQCDLVRHKDGQWDLLIQLGLPGVLRGDGLWARSGERPPPRAHSDPRRPGRHGLGDR